MQGIESVRSLCEGKNTKVLGISVGAIRRARMPEFREGSEFG